MQALVATRTWGAFLAVDLTCILLTWNSAAYVRRCLSSVFDDLDRSGIAYEVIVVDNGSSDSTLEELRAVERSALTVIPLGSNTGTTFSRNIAMRMAKGEFIAILDSDIEVHQADTFGRVLRFLRSQRDVGIVGPQLRFPSGRYQKTADVFPTIAHKARRFLGLRAMELREGVQDHGDAPREVDYVVSAFWMLPRPLLGQIGLLDEHIFYAPEDVDYCLRAALAGFRVVYLPGVSATHHAQELSRRRLLSRAFREHLKGLAYFYRKHGFALSLERIYARINAARSARRSS